MVPPTGPLSYNSLTCTLTKLFNSSKSSAIFKSKGTQALRVSSLSVNSGHSS